MEWHIVDKKVGFYTGCHAVGVGGKASLKHDRSTASPRVSHVIKVLRTQQL